MSELTDSYCERCGTRYTFGPSPTKGPSLTGARLLARGLKNFVMTDGTSMDEAMAAARIDVTKDESTRVTEEFHRTFNFCMTCRQYACDKCWNENQGACLSCAPLWDHGPIAPQDHLIVRTPVSRQDLGDAGKATLAADVASGPAGSPDAVAWPDEDELPGRLAPRPGGNGHRPVEAAPASPMAKATTWPEAPTFALAAPPEQELPKQTEPVARQKPQPGPQQPRQPARVSDEEQTAAEQLRAQAAAWKSRDDGWALWPLSDEPANTEMTLTPEELHLIKAQLSHAPSPDEPAASPTRAAAPEAQGFTPSHTLAEDAARVTEPEPGYGTEPERPSAGAWEPETPAPRKAPSSDFDLLGSLRQPIELPQPPLGPDPHRKPVIGRLLGQRAPTDESPNETAPKAPRPVKAPRQKGTGPTTPWPAPTRWVDRPVERHDWWGDAYASTVEGVAQPQAAPAKTTEPIAVEAGAENRLPAASAAIVFATLQPEGESEFEPEPESEPVRPTESEVERAPAQQPLFTTPSVPTDPWAAANPDLPARTPIEWPASDPLEPKPAPPATPATRRPATPAPVAAHHTVEPAPWPPIGARWPTQTSPAAPWPMPHADVPASVVAAARADQSEMAESPLVAALWAESAQQVLDRGTVRVCHHCALPVSTQARYCRRCGTRQG
jgi:hypothetical protein